MTDLAILDYSTNQCVLYHLTEEVEDIEKLIVNMGYNLDEIYYMVGNITFEELTI